PVHEQVLALLIHERLRQQRALPALVVVERRLQQGGRLAVVHRPVSEVQLRHPAPALVSHARLIGPPTHAGGPFPRTPADRDTGIVPGRGLGRGPPPRPRRRPGTVAGNDLGRGVSSGTWAAETRRLGDR